MPIFLDIIVGLANVEHFILRYSFKNGQNNMRKKLTRYGSGTVLQTRLNQRYAKEATSRTAPRRRVLSIWKSIMMSIETFGSYSAKAG